MKSRILLAVVLFLVIAACRGTFQIGLEHTPTSPTSVGSTATPAPTSTPQAPQATLASIPASPTPQLITPAPTPYYSSENIVMATGTTAGVVQGTIQPGQVVTYTLQAGQSQPMILIMTSPNNDVTLGVFEPNGNMLLNPANKWTHWQGLLPTTELYTIQVIGGATTENYTLTAKVAQLVNFASGTTSITLDGTTIKGYVFSYALGGGAGQTMTATLNVPASTAYIDIFGLATGSLLSSAARATTWTGVLPQTQDYVIEVIPNYGQVVNYSLTVSIGSTAGNIIMAPGTTAGVVQGTLQPGQVVTYTLEAGQSQPMILILNSPNNDVTLGVFEPNGNMLLNPANKWTRWQALLPQTELYRIQVIGGATAENYTLTAKVPQLVNFATGTSSITLNGTTINGYVFSYAFNCSAGQTMTATLNVPSSTAYIDIFGLATGSLLSSAAKATTWTGVLPQTQDYVIEVIPNNGQVVNYSLTVSVGSTAGNIIMTPGTTAGVVQGTLQPGQVLTYTLQAGQSQPMILIMDSPNKDVTLGVFEPNGSMLLNPANKWTRWQGLLPQTELYRIQVIGGATAENYTLTAKVAQVVHFAAGTSSITLNGTTVNGYVFSYAFSCSAGQTMTATLNVPSSTAYLDIFGLSTGFLLDSSLKATTWTGVLSQTQDYVIEVIPNNGQVVNYSLTVSVH